MASHAASASTDASTFFANSPPREFDLNELLIHSPRPPSKCEWWPPRSLPHLPLHSSGFPSPPESSAPVLTRFFQEITGAEHQLIGSRSSPYSACLRLSDVAAALNALPRSSDSPEPNSPAQLLLQVPARSIDLLSFPRSEDPDLSVVNELLGKAPHSVPQATKRSKQTKGSNGRKSTKASTMSQKKTKASLRSQEKLITKDPVVRREIHINSERQRRKGMTHLYATLHSLLPEGKLKTDRCSVLTETMKYIRILRQQLEELGSKKAKVIAEMGLHKITASMPTNECYIASGDDGGTTGADAETEIVVEAARVSEEASSIEPTENFGVDSDTSTDVAVRFFGGDAFITLRAMRKKGVWSGLLQILDDQNVEVINATLSASPESDFHCIHAKVPNTSQLCSFDLQRILNALVLAETKTIPCRSSL